MSRQGYDINGYPVTAGGERVSNQNWQSKEKYKADRGILETYNKIKQMNNDINTMGHRRPGGAEALGRDSIRVERVSVNRDKIQKMRDSVSEQDLHRQGNPQSVHHHHRGDQNQERRSPSRSSMVNYGENRPPSQPRNAGSRERYPQGNRSRSRSKSPKQGAGHHHHANQAQPQHHQHIKQKGMNYMELEEETNQSHTLGPAYQSGPSYDGRAPLNALIKESLLLSDNEVTISFMKFMIGVAILNFPAESSFNGIFNGFVSTAIIVYLIAKSNENLVKAIPLELMNQNLTYGEIAGAIFGHKSYQNVVDFVLLLCQGSNYILYLKYVGDQLNQVVCQETDGRFCAINTQSYEENKYFLLYYYVPVSIAVLVLAQVKNYKQISYISKIALIATIIAILVLILDALFQIMVYMRAEAFTLNKNTVDVVQIYYQENDQTKHIRWFMPFYPYFLDCFCKIQISFEGAPMVPRLYTNAKNKNFFVRNLNRAVLYLGLLQAFIGIICVMAYGNKLQEIVLMNLNYGLFSNFIKLLYAIGMIVNLVLQLYPILEMIETHQPRVFGYGTSPNQNRDKNVNLYIYDPNKRSFGQMLTKFMNTLFLVSVLLLLTWSMRDFHTVLLVDGAILTNILMLMLPNALYLHQVNYGYLKAYESRSNYAVAVMLFYLSIFNIIYASFRGVQLLMGQVGVHKIVTVK